MNPPILLNCTCYNIYILLFMLKKRCRTQVSFFCMYVSPRTTNYMSRGKYNMSIIVIIIIMIHTRTYLI